MHQSTTRVIKFDTSDHAKKGICSNSQFCTIHSHYLSSTPSHAMISYPTLKKSKICTDSHYPSMHPIDISKNTCTVLLCAYYKILFSSV